VKGRKPKLTVIQGGRVAGKCPAAPSWLSAHAKAEWKRVAPQLHSRSLLSPEAMATLESYCVAVGTVRELEEVMRDEGRILKVDGEAKTHPAFRMQGAAMREARLLACELGLTPHRRGEKGSGGKGGDSDGWDADLLA
jgi:P27 family predicted phage terminase small subunit